MSALERPQSWQYVEMCMLLTSILAHAVARAAAHHISEAGPQGEAHSGKLLRQGGSLGPCEQPGCPATARILLSRRSSSAGPNPIEGSKASASKNCQYFTLVQLPGYAAAPN